MCLRASPPAELRSQAPRVYPADSQTARGTASSAAHRRTVLPPAPCRRGSARGRHLPPARLGSSDFARAVSAIQQVQPEDQTELELFGPSNVLVTELLGGEARAASVTRARPLGPSYVEARVSRISLTEPLGGCPDSRRERGPD